VDLEDEDYSTSVTDCSSTSLEPIKERSLLSRESQQRQPPQHMRLPPDFKALRHRSLPHPDPQCYEATLRIPETTFLPMRASLDPYSLRRSSSSRYDQVIQRLSTTMKTVTKGILKDHLVPVASSMTCSGNLSGFNNAGYKVTFHPLKVQVRLTESTLFTPMKCLRSPQRDAILTHLDVWSHHVHGASMRYLTLSYLLRFCNEDQLKSNKEYGDGLYAILALMRTDQEKARYTFLNDVDYLVEDNAMDDICLSSELDGTFGMPTLNISVNIKNF
jgi:DNA-directed RNA polymerase-5 subunit 1